MKLVKIANAPKINVNSKGAKSFILSCIDPRFSEFLAHFLLKNKMLKDNYDLVNLAGASLGANQTTFKEWKKTLKNHIDIALQLHNITEFLVFDHMDCGAYKVFLELPKDDDPHIHVNEIEILRKWVNKNYPQLKFKGFIMDTDGAMYEVV
jgi:carbonic anhydrase